MHAHGCAYARAYVGVVRARMCAHRVRVKCARVDVGAVHGRM